MKYKVLYDNELVYNSNNRVVNVVTKDTIVDVKDIVDNRAIINDDYQDYYINYRDNNNIVTLEKI